MFKQPLDGARSHHLCCTETNDNSSDESRQQQCFIHSTNDNVVVAVVIVVILVIVVVIVVVIVGELMRRHSEIQSGQIGFIEYEFVDIVIWECCCCEINNVKCLKI